MCRNASPVNIVCGMVLRKYVSAVIVKNLTDFRKTVEVGVDPRLVGQSTLSLIAGSFFKKKSIRAGTRLTRSHLLFV